MPLYDCQYSEVIECNEQRIDDEMAQLAQWQKDHAVKLFIGEFGICRETGGAADYLRAVAAASLERGMSCLVYSYRETTWDAMNYELGPRLSAAVLNTRLPWNDNPLVGALLDISRMNTASQTREQ